MAVVLDQVDLKIDSQLILNNVSINLKKGTIYALCGPSGCGKSSLCQAILGLRKISRGSISIFSSTEIPGKDSGYMPQSISLHDYLTGKETLYFHGQLLGLTYEAISHQISTLAVKFQLSKHLDRRISQWSHGQQRRLSLSCALIHSPRLLILDEPTVGVDPVLREIIWAELESRVSSDDHVSVLITTHYLGEAEKSNTVGFMRHGQILAQASPQTLTKQLACADLNTVFLRLCQDKHPLQGVEKPALVLTKTSEHFEMSLTQPF